MAILGFGKDPRSHLSRVAIRNGCITAITYHSGPGGYKVEIVLPDSTVVSNGVLYDNFRQACSGIREYLETQQ